MIKLGNGSSSSIKEKQMTGNIWDLICFSSIIINFNIKRKLSIFRSFLLKQDYLDEFGFIEIENNTSEVQLVLKS